MHSRDKFPGSSQAEYEKTGILPYVPFVRNVIDPFYMRRTAWLSPNSCELASEESATLC